MKHLTIFLLMCMTAFGAWDNTLPADSSLWNNAAGFIRDNNDALEVVMGVDLVLNHPYFQSATPTFKPDGTTALDSDDLGRLWVDSDDLVMYVFSAITPTWTPFPSTAGSNTWAVAPTWTLGVVANNVWLAATDVAGTGTVNLMKVDASDQPFISDEVWTVTNAAPVDDKALANKKYVDDNAGFTKVVTTSTVLDSTALTNATTSPFVLADGKEAMTVTIASLTVGDIIEVEAFAVLGNSTADNPQIAIFESATSASLAVASADSDTTSNGEQHANIKGWFTASGASHTFTLRFAGAAGTTTLNGAFGDTNISWISATQLKASNITIN